MKLRIISGRSGTGKSSFIRAEVVEAVKAGKNAILIVPDQYTFDAETKLMQALGGGMIGAQVLGFTRLAERVLNEAGGWTRPFLNSDGKMMALRKVIEERKSELSVYKSVSARGGFAQKFCDLIANFKYAAIAPGELIAAAQNVGDELLKQKLHDIAVLYEGLEVFMAGRYIDSEDMQALLAERIPQAGFLKNAEVFIDSLPFFLYKTQTYRIIEQLLLVCNCVSVTIRCGKQQDEDAGIFEEEKHIGERLFSIAQDNGIIVEKIVLGTGKGQKRIAAPAVQAVEKYLFTPIPPQAKQNSEGIMLVEAPNRKGEVEAAVNRINELLRAGAHYRDIAVVLGEPDAYKPLLRRAFLAHDFSYYMDEKRALISHPIVELILASLYASLRGFRRDEVLRAAKTGYANISDAQAEIFEIYCLRFGISFSAFVSPFEKSAKDCELLLEAEEARLLIMPPLAELAAALKCGKTAKEHAEAVYNYLCSLHVREKLLDECETLVQEGRFDDSAENSQVWNSLMTLLDQIAVLLDGEMTAARFAAVMEEGCAAHEIGVIPASTDQILIGDVERTSNRDIEHLIVLGCNDGAIPRENGDEGIINSADCERIKAAGCILDSDNSMLHERQIVYACFARAQKTMVVSWALADSNGKTLAPSSVADRLKKLFPAALCSAPTAGIASAYCESRGFSKLVKGLRALSDSGQAEQGLAGAFAYFSKTDDPRLAFVTRLSFANAVVDAKRLFSTWPRSSVSRIETFNSCPYKHMVKYGLKPSIRREYKERAADEGIYYHAAFDKFVQQMSSQGIDWEDLDEPSMEAMLTPILDELEESHNDGILKTGARNIANARKLRRTAQKTLFAAIRQIQAGDYRPRYSEMAFVFGGDELDVILPNGEKAALCGVVDRVDVHNGAVRIVDYKSGSQGFGFDELAAGTKLQLPLYMIAALKKIGQDNGGIPSKPAGMFYLKVDDPILEKSESAEECEGLKRYRLDGVVIKDEEIVSGMDASMERYSDVLRVQRTKEGLKGDGLLSEAQMQEMLSYAKEKTAEGIKEIFSGSAQILPVRNKKWTACQHCDYRAVCRFEPNTGQFKTVETLDAAAFFKKIAKDSSDVSISENEAAGSSLEVYS